MAFCIVCYQADDSDSQRRSLDYAKDNEKTLRCRLEEVLNEAVIGDRWMCLACQSDLTQIETYYSLLTVFKQRYRESARRYEEQLSCRADDMLGRSLLMNTNPLTSEILLNIDTTNLPIGSESLLSIYHAQPIVKHEPVSSRDVVDLAASILAQTESEPSETQSDCLQSDLSPVIIAPQFEQPESDDETFELDESGLEQAKLGDEGLGLKNPVLASPLSGVLGLVHKDKRSAGIICEVCKKAFVGAAALQNHMVVHTGEKPYECEICYTGFSQPVGLKRHMRIHTGEKPHVCKVCKKKFRQRGSLIEHMRLHTGEKPYTCKICDKGFTQSNSLKRHMSVHTDARPCKCGICGKTFKSPGVLQIHSKTHMGGDRADTCPICGIEFLHKNTLDMHMATHRDDKPFTCLTCGESFQVEHCLKKHITTHGDHLYQCLECGKGFVQAEALAIHLRKHTGERLFTCDICGKGFKQSGYLKVHKRTHSEERPYPCPVCGRPFREANKMKRHMRIHARTANDVEAHPEPPFECNDGGNKNEFQFENMPRQHIDD